MFKLFDRFLCQAFEAHLISGSQTVQLRRVLGVECGEAALQRARALAQHAALALVRRAELRARAPRRAQRLRLLRQRLLAARPLLLQPAGRASRRF